MRSDCATAPGRAPRGRPDDSEIPRTSPRSARVSPAPRAPPLVPVSRQGARRGCRPRFRARAEQAHRAARRSGSDRRTTATPKGGRRERMRPSWAKCSTPCASKPAADRFPCANRFKNERRSYCSKKSSHLRYSAIVAAPGHDDLPHVELARSERDPLVRNEHRGRAQVSTAGGAEHVEEIRQAFRTGNRDRFATTALPAGKERSCDGVGTRAAVAFGVLDSRAPL